jgi:hypothetical protein
MKKLFLVLVISILAISFVLAAKTEAVSAGNQPVLIAVQEIPLV